MSDEEIKKIAKLTISEGKINQTVARFVLERFSGKYLRKYLVYLKRMTFEKSVRIITSEDLSSAMKNELEHRFEGKNIFYEVDNTLGDGIKVKIGDTVIDLSLKNYLDNIVKGLKN